MKTLNLSARAALAKPSPTLAITAKANAMKAAGIDVVGFAAGEPDFPTPDAICQIAIDAIKSGFTKYTPTSGIAELKEAISRKLERDNQVHVSPEQIVVSCGAKQSLYEAMQMLLDPGDEVILFAPYWMTYRDQIILAGGVPVLIRTFPENGFLPRIEAVREQITAHTKMIVVNSPCNPTGAVFPRQLLKEIAELALRHDLWLVCDEIYEKLVYGAAHVSMASLGREVAERTVTIGGCSKSFAMTGWRIGWSAAPPEIARALASFQDAVTSNPTSFAQKGAVAAYALSPDKIESMRAEFEQRRDLIRRELSDIPNLAIPCPQGAFYLLVDFSAYLGGEAVTDFDLAEILLNKAGVATIPGSVFEADGFLRLSYSASKENIRKGIARIRDILPQIAT